MTGCSFGLFNAAMLPWPANKRSSISLECWTLQDLKFLRYIVHPYGTFLNDITKTVNKKYPLNYPSIL
jgi:hypothetical protein